MAARRSIPCSPALVDLPALLASVSDEALLADPALPALVVEYACWELQLADWHAGQLPRRDPEFKSLDRRRATAVRPARRTQARRPRALAQWRFVWGTCET